MHMRDCSCAPILRFFLRRQMAPQQTAKFRTALFGQFFTSLKDSVASYAWIGRYFRHLLRGLDVLYIALNVS